MFVFERRRLLHLSLQIRQEIDRRILTNNANQEKQIGAQAEGIAAAKAEGIKFGRPPIPLPANFYETHKAWRTKKLTLKQVAEACNMLVGTFYRKAIKFVDTT